MESCSLCLAINNHSVVMVSAVVNSDACVGRGCIVNIGATVDHDCLIGDYVHEFVGGHVTGIVAIGGSTWNGAAADSNNVNICDDCDWLIVGTKTDY